MNEETRVVKADLGDGVVVHVEVHEPLETEADVSIDDVLAFDGVGRAIEAISSKVVGSLKKAQPDRAVVELGLDLAVEAGTLTALIAKGKGSAALTVTLEWTSAGAAEGSGG